MMSSDRNDKTVTTDISDVPQKEMVTTDKK